MPKTPSAVRTTDLVHYRQAKANQKKRNIRKLQDEITEHERVLKQHPMGAITLNAIIKEKRAKLEEMTKNVRKFQKAPTQVAENAEEKMEKRSKQGLKGLAVPKKSFIKAIYTDGILKAKRKRSSNFSDRDINSDNISNKFRTSKCADAGAVEGQEKFGSNCHGMLSKRKQSAYLCKYHYDVRCGMYLGL